MRWGRARARHGRSAAGFAGEPRRHRGARRATPQRPAREVDDALKDRRFVRLSLGDEEGYTTAGKWEELKALRVAALTAHHRAEPLSPGLEMEALRERLPYEVSARAFRALVDRLGRESDLVREESVLRFKSHRVKLGGDEGELGERLAQALNSAGFHPPDLKQLAEELKLPARRTSRGCARCSARSSARAGW